MLVFLCIPVSPGKSRVIWAFPRNVGVWLDKVIPRWYYHIGQNLILDSDIQLLHIEANDSSTEKLSGSEFLMPNHVMELKHRSHCSSFISGARAEEDRKSTRLNSSHITRSRMPSSA